MISNGCNAGEDMKTRLTMTQRPVLSQRMQLSAKILQMNTIELNTYIQEIVLENPLIEIEPEEKSKEMEIEEWLDSREYAQQDFYKEKNEDVDRRNYLDYGSERGESLYDSLFDQLLEMNLEKRQKNILEFLIFSLNEDGYLNLTDMELAESLEISISEVQWAIKLLQTMEPPGIGARDLKECLMIQVLRMGKIEVDDEQFSYSKEINLKSNICETIQNYLPLLAEKQFPQIGKALGITKKQVQWIYQIICGLNPKPGNGFSSRQPVSFILPDIYVVSQQGNLEVFLNREHQLSIHICEYYRKLALQVDNDPELEAYMAKKMEQAKWIVRCVEQRKNTLKRCAEILVERQKDFFLTGCKILKPLILSDLATELQVSESTISRTMKNKYLKCEFGVFSLASFFSLEVGKDTGQTQSSIFQEMRNILSEEDPAAPLSDQEIMEALLKKGVVVSRRTVTKYRMLQEIPSASVRKREYLEK